MNIETLKKAGEIHKEIQHFIMNILKPDTKLIEIADVVETKIKSYSDVGIAFPVGLSINNCACHYTPNTGDTTVLKYDDLLKVDFGVHIDGYIIDGAFTWSACDKYNELIKVSEEATQCGINNSGPDAVLSDIGSAIQEIIESSEITIDKKVHSLKSIPELCGHQIGRYDIHCGKAVPNIYYPCYIARMSAGEEYAIEPFVSTGSGNVIASENFEDCSHFMLSKYKIHNEIYSRFSHLPFCRKWSDDSGLDLDLAALVDSQILLSYPPMYDTAGSYVAQTEKSIFITENGNVVVLN